MIERLMDAEVWTWACEIGVVGLVVVLVLIVAYVTYREFVTIDEAERGREEEVDDEQ
ncbi:hypothetical protein ES705_31936 [subsurface metagenome]